MRSIYRRDDPISEAPSLLLDAKAASRALGICPKSLWSLTKRGEIKCCRIGSRVLYSRSSLEAFIAEREAACQKPAETTGTVESRGAA